VRASAPTCQSRRGRREIERQKTRQACDAPAHNKAPHLASDRQALCITGRRARLFPHFWFPVRGERADVPVEAGEAGEAGDAGKAGKARLRSGRLS
jgi:hypothetical protein